MVNSLKYSNLSTSGVILRVTPDGFLRTLRARYGNKSERKTDRRDGGVYSQLTCISQ